MPIRGLTKTTLKKMYNNDSVVSMVALKLTVKNQRTNLLTILEHDRIELLRVALFPNPLLMRRAVAFLNFTRSIGFCMSELFREIDFGGFIL